MAGAHTDRKDGHGRLVSILTPKSLQRRSAADVFGYVVQSHIFTKVLLVKHS